MHDVNDELSNLERQRESTQRIVNEIERQIGGLASQLDRSSAELILAEDNLAERRAVLERRLVDIYKRGTLYTYQALLRGRIVRRPAQPLQVPLPHQPAGPRAGDRRRAAPEPRGGRAQHHPRRAHPARPLPPGARGGVRQVHRPRQARARRLESLQRSARSTERRLTTLQKDEARLNGLLAALERARRDEAARGALRGARRRARLDHHGEPRQARLAGRRHDRLPFRAGHAAERRDHPLERGRDRGARWARRCTRWRRGRCGWWDNSGPTGSRSSWSTGTATTPSTRTSSRPRSSWAPPSRRAQTVGAVGGENSDYGPHLHFEIRGENQVALDPTTWLRKR